MSGIRKEYPAAKARIYGKKKAFLVLLSKNGLIEVACQKLDVSRQTFYRWKKEDGIFREEADAAMRRGSETTDDLVESQFMKLIHNGDRSSIHFYLKYRHAKYSDRGAIRRMITEQQQEATDVTKEDEERIEMTLRAIREHQSRCALEMEAVMDKQKQGEAPAS